MQWDKLLGEGGDCSPNLGFLFTSVKSPAIRSEIAHDDEGQRSHEIREIAKLVDQIAALSHYQIAKVHGNQVMLATMGNMSEQVKLVDKARDAPLNPLAGCLLRFCNLG